MYRFLIIGAGVSGLAFARLLQMSGENNFRILEADESHGGLCRSQSVGTHTVDLGGGHFLCSKFPEVYEFIFSHIPKTEFNFFERISKIKISDALSVDYPIELNLWQLPEESRHLYLKSISQSGESQSLRQPSDFENWIQWKFGKEVSNAYMLPYNRKVWGVNPSELDTDWLEKIPRVTPEVVLESCRRERSSAEHFPSHATFYYPKFGGFQRIVDSIFFYVKEKVNFQEPVLTLEKKEGFWLINKKHKAKFVINTAPWPSLFEALGPPIQIESDFQLLRANSIMVSLWEKSYSHKWHWRYLPDQDLEAHREFFIANYALESDPTGIVTETEFKRWPGPGAEWRSGTRPIFEHRVSNAYPIPVRGHDQAIKNILAHYQAQGLFGLGRWGQWKYFNSDICILEAMKLHQSLRLR